MTAPTGRLVSVEIDDSGLSAPTPEIEQERRIAIFDLLERNSFAPRAPGTPPGPYRLTLGAEESELVLRLATEAGAEAGTIRLPLAVFAQPIKDYFAICASYFDAVKHLPPGQIEAFDAARRSIHDEATRLVLERLAPEVETDPGTARRLFTLISVLHAAP